MEIEDLMMVDHRKISLALKPLKPHESKASCLSTPFTAAARDSAVCPAGRPDCSQAGNMRVGLRGGRLLGAGAASAAAAAAVASWYASPSAADKKPPKALKPQLSEMPMPKPGLELLVHNISHSDLVVSVKEEAIDRVPLPTPGRTFLARPLFNSFMPVTNAIESDIDRQMAEGTTPGVISCQSRYNVQYPTGIDLLQDGQSSGAQVPSKPPAPPPDGGAGAGSSKEENEQLPAAAAWAQFHLKSIDGKPVVMGRDLASEGRSAPRVIAVYLPLLAVVLPEWLRSIKRRMVQAPNGTPPPRKVLVLVSGAGQPRDERANPGDNSTEGVGHIMQRFLKLVHPDIEVHIPPDHPLVAAVPSPPDRLWWAPRGRCIISRARMGSSAMMIMCARPRRPPHHSSAVGLQRNPPFTTLYHPPSPPPSPPPPPSIRRPTHPPPLPHAPGPFRQGAGAARHRGAPSRGGR